jgi:hypothetical protein
MKNKLLAVSAIFGMVASASAVKINNNLSINGFIDGSYNLTDNAGATADTQGLGIDEVELNFELNVGNVSGAIHIDNNNERNYLTGITNAQNSNFGAGDINSTDTVASGNAGSHNGLDIEQAHFTYNINDAVSVTFGRYGSALGFEREDPAGLYTYSRAYSGNFNLGNVDAAAVDGITIAYSGDSFSLAASFEEAAGQNLETEDLNLELSFSYTGIAGVNIGGGFFFDNAEDSAAEVDILNLHASKQVGKLLLAAEYIELSSDGGDNDAYLLLADYDFNDKLGVAVRFSQNEQGDDADYEKFTIAPNYAITDSLGAILEYSDVDNNNADSEEYAVELTYTF